MWIATFSENVDKIFLENVDNIFSENVDNTFHGKYDLFILENIVIFFLLSIAKHMHLASQ